MGMIPGMDKAMKDIDVSDDAFKPIEAIINSMTPKERENPGLMNGSRKNRIAAGAGVSLVEVNRFLKQFEQMGKMMRKVQVMQQSGKRFRRLRGNWLDYQGIPVMPTYHPAFLLRQEAAKRDAWHDLQLVMKRLRH